MAVKEQERVIYLELPDYLIGYNCSGEICLNACFRGTNEGIHYLKRLSGAANLNYALEFDGDTIIRKKAKKITLGGTRVIQEIFQIAN